MKEMVGGCCVCSDDRGWPENPLVYCDGQSCTVAVHQACYGIVSVPTGPWYCRKCESQERSVKVKCELCPSKYGALKRTDTNAWAHVVCALYIPEVRFGNVTTMEPIQLQMIPAERFSKTCYICEEGGKASSASFGACMQCNKTGCKQQFHVTCAQGLGLLCEEAGNYLDNVKYCGYCQHHYSKLKKGGNVKTIPPYKPVSDNHNSDSNSEREAEQANQANITRSISQASSTSTSSSKRKSSSNSKNSTSSSKTGASTKSSAHQKSIHNSGSKASSAEKKSNNSKSAKNVTEETPGADVSDKSDKKEVIKEVVEETVKEVKEGKGKKRKASSRTPTPVTVVSSVVENVSAVSGGTVSVDVGTVVPASIEKKEVTVLIEPLDRPKKIKTDSSHTPTIVQTPPAAPSVTPTINSSTPSPVIPETTAASPSPTTTSVATSSIIQSTATLPPINSLVVSVPLHSASLSPHSHIINNQSSSATQLNFHSIQERSSSVELTPPISSSNSIMTGGSGSQTGVITSELGGGDLRIVYEKQVQPTNSALQIDLERATPTPELPPTKRARSQSADKNDKPARTKKRAAAAAAASTSYNNNSGGGGNSGTKRSSRSQSSLEMQSVSYSSLSQNSIKESPPSSPSSESLGAAPTNGRRKGRKSAPASVCGSSVLPKESKDVKIFQNGIHAPHMLGNQLNPNSNMAQKMSDHLNSELEAHSIFNTSEASCALVGPPLQHRVIQSVRSNSTGGSSTASGGSGLSSMLGGGSGVLPQTLEQLLERHWEQGSQFLMEQAQHFDIASLLTCLHQLRAENLRLEEHVTALVQRRDHLLAINARLALPLVGQPPHSNSHTVNNIHPHVSSTQNEPSRQRHASYSSHNQNPPVENGIPPDQYGSQHRSPVTAPQPQPSPQSVRHSPAGGSGYPGGGLLRQNVPETSSRSASRSQQYPMAAYQGPSPTSQQMMMRRDSDLHHQSSSKPS